MTFLIKGQKIQLSQLSLTDEFVIIVETNIRKNIKVDINCFGVNPENKLFNKEYFISDNQLSSPCKSIENINNNIKGNRTFKINLSTLPSSIIKLVFSLTIEQHNSISELEHSSFKIINNQGKTLAEYNFYGREFQEEKALIIAEIYLKQVWRLGIISQGFKNGLNSLLEQYGTKLDDIIIIKSEPKISLEKRLEKKAPQLINLVKKVDIQLQKSNLSNIMARVAFVLDASGSMSFQYSSGNVQAVLERIMALAIRFDDNEELESWAYADKYRQLDNVNIDNITGYINRLKEKKGGFWEILFSGIIQDLGIGNNEPPVMQDVVDYYKNTDIPAFIIFISDGGIYREKDIAKILINASKYPIFWQFVGLGGSNYGVLEKLDSLKGRTTDNADFFAIDDFKKVTDEELYKRLLNEFPKWLKKFPQLKP
ncbi:vWA domain-containing protein [Geminocystis herdmanii]|uniref:vWA domain-containing protein n=1 Tax=Geminocystis herdmanii TaxID=669359 RepID=UPI0003465B91|nr:VWA domain-containing protein [Geminocystis herdmanii]